ncbi:CDP-diacylglycerol diphosphatase [Methylobacterium sp. NEAU K]|uniref:CDP-diacylglycerol diphosphatase n=1 Tax=Methylobacterium sp. NEAU K TaxID=3064946 RepID=UPI0027323484|nr:CDP-diacylglycerol diphosphatase [Methylobacterium sp. NEAU K]MDP4005998.1 CDP-diacylglycerol diphosphatase [Methylobacterium sp. NEAU K]
MRRMLVAAILLAVTSVPAATAANPTRDVLWVALQACLLAKKAAGRTFPCLDVDLGDAGQPGTAVLRAPGQPTHIVVMPTADVSGIEAPVLQGPHGIAYWRAALAARHYVSAPLEDRLPVAAVGLEVNSVGGRSQDQLHIHLDCMRPSVMAALKAHGGAVGGTWAPFPVALEDEPYVAMRVPAEEVDHFNPFAALARVPGWRTSLHDASFAAVGAASDDPRGGMIVLAYRASDASAEELMDHSCRVARPRKGS